MLNTTESKKLFWDKKILGWEKKNYEPRLLWGHPIRNRRKLFLNVAETHLKGKLVYEAGCGSAGILEELFSRGIKYYVGCDFSEVAIAQAKVNAARLGLTARTEFHCRSVLDFQGVQSDFTFSLGLWDWLSDREVFETLKSTKSPYFVHSFSEKRKSVSQLLHRAYVYSAYGHRDMSNIPKYRSTSQISDFFQKANQPQPKIHRDNRMSFSAFAYLLPKEF